MVALDTWPCDIMSIRNNLRHSHSLFQDSQTLHKRLRFLCKSDGGDNVSSAKLTVTGVGANLGFGLHGDLEAESRLFNCIVRDHFRLRAHQVKFKLAPL